MQQKEYKKNVLISAFNCSPYAGSEQYLGWSSAVATANYGYRTYVLTIDKTKQEIEKWFEEHGDTGLKDDLSFVYVSIPNNIYYPNTQDQLEDTIEKNKFRMKWQLMISW